MVKQAIYLVAAIVVLAINGCAKGDEWQEKMLDSSKKQTLYGMRYANGNDRYVLDVALPKNRTTNTPVVIFIHGGAWVAGDKGVFATDIQQYAEQGIACATLNYRFADDAKNIHHPDLPQDVMKAVEYIAGKSDLWKVSPTRFGLVGHSAGGHLSLSTAYSFDTNHRIKACASWAGPLNFLEPQQWAITWAPDIFKIYTGTALNTASDTLKYKEASPYWVVGSTSIPTLLVYGTADATVPYVIGTQMKAKLDSLGVPNSMTILNGADHVWTGNNLTTARSNTLEWFLQKL